MRFSPYYIPVVLGLALTVPAASPASAQIAVSISVPIAPPPLPYYVQPPIPEPGYIWTPGYWAYADEDGYYWVPGTWVEPPSVGLYWTPAWWGFENGFYGFHPGYWGPHVGFYGGIDYGYGYNGYGFFGGRWNGGIFAYNSLVVNFGGRHFDNVYRETIAHNTDNHISFNGGKGGIRTRPNAEQSAAERDTHVQPTGEQMHHFQAAGGNPALRATANHGRPEVAATARPGAFTGRDAIPARAAGPGAAHSEAVTRGPAGGPRAAAEQSGGPAQGAASPRQGASRPEMGAGQPQQTRQETTPATRQGGGVNRAEHVTTPRPEAAPRAPGPVPQQHQMARPAAPQRAAQPPRPTQHAAPPRQAPQGGRAGGAPHGGGGGGAPHGGSGDKDPH
jgi:hypothetical protein